MDLTSAVKGMKTEKEALLEIGSASDPSGISTHTHQLSQYLGVLDDNLAEMEADLEIKESASFHAHRKAGKSPNAAKEIIRREFTKERADIIRIGRLAASGWKIVSEGQSRVKHLLAEAANQI